MGFFGVVGRECLEGGEGAGWDFLLVVVELRLDLGGGLRAKGFGEEMRFMGVLTIRELKIELLWLGGFLSG